MININQEGRLALKLGRRFKWSCGIRQGCNKSRRVLFPDLYLQALIESEIHMSNPFNTEGCLKLKSRGSQSFNNLDFIIYHGNIECTLWSNDNGETWSGSYINSDGWWNMTDKQAAVAAKMYGCIDMNIPIGETIEFDRPNVSDAEFDYAYGYSDVYPY